MSEGEYRREILYLGNAISDEDEDYSMENENIKVEELRLCSRCGKIMPKKCSPAARCEHNEDEYVNVFKVRTSNEKIDTSDGHGYSAHIVLL